MTKRRAVSDTSAIRAEFWCMFKACYKVLEALTGDVGRGGQIGRAFRRVRFF